MTIAIARDRAIRREEDSEVEVGGRVTRVLAEQVAAVDPQRLGDSAGRLIHEELRRVEAAVRVVLELSWPSTSGDAESAGCDGDGGN